MKQIFHKITSVIMVIVVLLSTMSFTIDKHYCGNTLVDTAIFHKAKGCGMEIQKTSATSECSAMKKSCCSDEQLVIEGQDELKITFDKLTLDPQYFIVSFVHTYIYLFDVEVEKTSISEYPPPLIVRQIYKLDESYLI